MCDWWIHEESWQQCSWVARYNSGVIVGAILEQKYRGSMCDWWIHEESWQQWHLSVAFKESHRRIDVGADACSIS